MPKHTRGSTPNNTSKGSSNAKDYFNLLQNASKTAPGSSPSRQQQSGNISTQPRSHTKKDNGAVIITLHSAKDDFDEKAEVKVELKNPDAVVEKMLQTLASKFPPESVVTIAAAPGIDMPPDEDRSTSTSSAMDFRRHSEESDDSPSDSSQPVGLSPLGSALLEPNRLSGRHYLGDTGELYPELADAKGRPIDRFVRDPASGAATPVGAQAYDPDGKPIPGMIESPNGRVMPGLPVAPDSVDPVTGIPRACYDGIDGSKPWEALDKNNQGLLGFAIDPYDGIVKPVGQAILGSDERPIPGVIRDKDGAVVSGIPLKPVPKIGDLEQPQQRSPPVLKPSDSIKEDKDAYPRHRPQRFPSGKLGSSDRPFQQPTPSGYPEDDDRRDAPRRGPQRPSQPQHPDDTRASPPSALYKYQAPQPRDSRERPSHPKAHQPSPADRIVPRGDSLFDEDVPQRVPSENLRDTSEPRRYLEPSGSSQRPTSSIPSERGRVKDTGVPTRIPAPLYRLDDGTLAPIAVGPDGRPLNGYAQDPKTGKMLPVGLPYSKTAPGLIKGPNGRPKEGLPVLDSAWDVPTQQPILYYVTDDDELVPMPIGENGQPLHGLARDPYDGTIKPVGLQLYSIDNEKINGRVVGPDGRSVFGIPIHEYVPPEPSVTELAPKYSPTASPSSEQMPRGIVVNRGYSDDDDHDEPTTTPQPEIQTQYVDVPLLTEKIVHVPKTEVVEIEKKVPKYQYSTVEQVVEVPRVEYIERIIEVPKYEEVIREIKVPQIIEVPKEVIRQVKKIETKIVEKIVEVPGTIVEVPKINYIEQKVSVPRYVDKEVPTIVAQKLQPIVREVPSSYEVQCVVTEPNVIAVDVFIPKPIQSKMRYIGKGEETHTPVDIPPPQFNALTQRLNRQLEDQHLHSLFVREGAGVPLLPVGERVETVEPVAADWIPYHQPGKLHVDGGDVLPTVNVQETLGFPKPTTQLESQRKNRHPETVTSYSYDGDNHKGHRSHAHASQRSLTNKPRRHQHYHSKTSE